MFQLLAQVHAMRGAMLSGPSCESGEFLPSDNWVGNNDKDNKLAKKGAWSHEQASRRRCGHAV